MPRPIYRCILSFLLLSVGPVWGGSIEGQIHVTKRLTKKRVTPVAGAYERGVSVARDLDTRGFKELELGRIAIYIDNLQQSVVSPAEGILEQKNQRFGADVLVIPAGSTVSFPNRDPIFHNVFSLSSAKSFDLGNYRQNESRSVTFNKPGIVQVYCHLHPDMNAAIVITPNGWSVKPDMNGRYLLSDVPDGKYQVTVWHRSAGFFRKNIEVRGATAQLDFLIPVLAAESK